MRRGSGYYTGVEYMLGGSTLDTGGEYFGYRGIVYTILEWSIYYTGVEYRRYWY